MEKKSKLSILTNGIIRENPTLVLLLGTCPFLATSSSLINALGMGLSATAVLICSNIVISLLRKVIPDKVRIPCYIVVIAGFVTLVQFVLQAYAPDINKALGVFIPLIVVNCIILGRAEAFANKNSVVDSALDGIGMGIGFTLALAAMGAIRHNHHPELLDRLLQPAAGRILRIRSTDRHHAGCYEGQGSQGQGLQLRTLPDVQFVQHR